MASTLLTDVKFNSKAFANAMMGEFTHKLAMLSSGIMQAIPDEVLSPNAVGYSAHIPQWNTLSGSSVPITSALSTSINSITQYESVFPWLEREMAWGANQIVKVVAGQDATLEIARQIGEYWAGEVHRVNILSLMGAFTTALASTHSTGATYSGSAISLQAGIAAKGLLGDNQDNLTAVVWNSAVYNDAKIQKIVTELPNTQGAVDTYNTGQITSFLGSQTFTTDLLAAVSDVYPTYFGASGACAYKFRTRMQNAQNNSNVYAVATDGMNIEVEVARNSTTAGGQDYLITRASLCAGVLGTAWDLTAVASNPTDVELATGSNWTKTATDNKLIRITELLTAGGAA